MSERPPIEIVGGGVAGLALGLALRRRDVPVTIFEAGDYPRHRVCGEFLAGLRTSTLDRLGLRSILADAPVHRRASFHRRGRLLYSYALPENVLGLSRHALDARLARDFVEAGGELRTNFRQPDETARPGRIFANGRRRRGPFWVGLKMHVHHLRLATDLEVHLGDRAYVGLSSVETGAVNLCGIFAPREISAHGPALMPAYLRAAGLAALAGRVEEAEIDAGSCCVTAAALGDRARRDDGLVRIGDAGAVIPPFTGHGLAMALQSAEIALELLSDYAEGRLDWAEAAGRLQREHRRRFRRRLAVADWLHPFFIQPRRQALLAALANLRLLPFGPLYAWLH